jgi:hypothetical protein
MEKRTPKKARRQRRDDPKRRPQSRKPKRKLPRESPNKIPRSEPAWVGRKDPKEKANRLGSQISRRRREAPARISPLPPIPFRAVFWGTVFLCASPRWNSSEKSESFPKTGSEIL